MNSHYDSGEVMKRLYINRIRVLFLHVERYRADNGPGEACKKGM